MKTLGIEILTTHKNPGRQQAIVDSWLRDHKHMFYTDIVNKVGNQVGHTKLSDHKSAEIKFVCELNRIKKNPYADWYLFCDDDTVPNLNLILSGLDDLDSNIVYGRSVSGSWRPDKSLQYCSGGAGFLVSNSLLESICNIEMRNVGFSDVNFGLLLREYKKQQIHDDKFLWTHPNKFNLDINNTCDHDKIRKYKSFHYIKDLNEIKTLSGIFL